MNEEYECPNAEYEAAPAVEVPILPAIPNTYPLLEKGAPTAVAFPNSHRTVSYYETADGDQWRMIVGEHGRVDLRCGRLGWGQNLKPFLVSMPVLQRALQGRQPRLKAAIVKGNYTVTFVNDSRGTPWSLFVIDERGVMLPLKPSERMWIHACMLAGGMENQVLSDRQFAEALKRHSRLMAALLDQAIATLEGKPHVHGPGCSHHHGPTGPMGTPGAATGPTGP